MENLKGSGGLHAILQQGKDKSVKALSAKNTCADLSG